MTREDFRDWATAHDCDVEPVWGLNHTSYGLRVFNKYFPRFYTYLDLPVDDTEMPDKMVKHACEQLHIPLPDCAKGK